MKAEAARGDRRSWRARLVRLMPAGSLARHLLQRLLPAVIVLVVLDLALTWMMTRTVAMEYWLLRDIFWLLMFSQVLLVGLFAWVVISGVRSGLRSINRIAGEIRQRSIEDLQTLDVRGLPTEIAPVVVHVNDLLLRLDESIQAQRRFVGQAAHQLRTPLAGLKMECELMLAQDLTEDVRVRAERIKSVTDRMIRLGRQLLVLARADPSTRPQDSFLRTDLAEWARINGGEWIPAAREQGVDLSLNAPETAVWVDADPLLLEELLGNLVDNALRYARGGRNIRLQVTANPPSLAVEDDGPGIDSAEVGRVFDAFYRSPAAGGGGSGLGLAIVREIARAHGAWWSLVSRPRFPGTRISIVFPGPRIGARLNRQDHG